MYQAYLGISNNLSFSEREKQNGNKLPIWKIM